MLKKLSTAIIAALVIGGAAFAQSQMAPTAQTAGVKRTVIQKFDVPAGDRETVVAVIELPPNADVARHTHPGPEVDYVLEGEVNMVVGSDPAKTFKPGDSFVIPQGVPHGGKSGPNGTKLVGTYVVEKGKPLASPAP
jgi:quercetin dioxygenase-like cupin family protein